MSPLEKEILGWALLVVLSLVGLAGSVLPGIPGIALILVGALSHKLLLPSYLSWWTIGITAFAAFAAWMTEVIGVLLGAKWAKASKYGLIGTSIGALVGIFFLPLGILIGPVIGAFVGELFALRTMKEALRSGLGAGVGFTFSLVLRAAIAGVVAIIILVDLFI